MALKQHNPIPDNVPAKDLAPLPDLDVYSDAQLIIIRSDVDRRLNIEHIGAIDLGTEIMVQLRTLKAMMHAALMDAEAPHNQKAQTAATVNRMLQDLVRSRSSLYNAERMKAIEEMTIEAMKDAPEEAKEDFMHRLEKLLATLPTLDSLMAEGE